MKFILICCSLSVKQNARLQCSDTVDIKKSQMVKEYKNWGKEYRIEFGIKVIKLPSVQWVAGYLKKRKYIISKEG